tara:strand:+ start:4106 stop:4717 length:612 start_codon:yes stop_codon:yes gene_type:complete
MGDTKCRIDLSGLRERIAGVARAKVLEAEANSFLQRKEQLRIHANLENKEYNEKVSNIIMGTNMIPRVVGKVNMPNPSLCYDFVDFGKIDKKDPIEYINPDKLDYLIPNPDKEKNKLKEDMPLSFFEIKEGEVEKGKEWYMKRDPKLPDGIAELMARYNWGDIKHMPNKNCYKNAQKKAEKKGKDILDGKLEIKKGNFLVCFD